MAEFDSLCKDIGRRYKMYENKRLSAKKRERKEGGVRLFKIQLQNRLLMLLIYYRMYMTYTLTGFLFDIAQSNVYRNIKRIEPLVRQCLPIPQKLYGIAKIGNNRRGRTIFSWLQGIYRCNRAANPQTGG